MSDPRTAARRVSEFKKPRRADQEASQEQRRANALAEQKKKRAERIESSRNIDLFQNLSISSTLPSITENRRQIDEDDEGDDEDGPQIAHQGLAQFVSMLPAASSEMLPPVSEPLPEQQLPTSFVGRNKPKKSSKSKGKNSNRARARSGDMMDDDGPHQRYDPLANSIMYAELLEMFPLATDPYYQIPDTLPSDLLTGWTVLSPIPTGKRCLAVSYQATQNTNSSRSDDKSHVIEFASSSDAGPSGSCRTLLHSRVQGKPFLTFPSPLPPDSILDCILDHKWKDTGILHVVDILRWRGKDFVDCETEFRFWWRDAKLSEMLKTSPIPEPSSAPPPSSSSQSRRFAHPTHFLPVPYFPSPLSYQTLLQVVIPAARAGREVTVELPPPVPVSIGNSGRRKRSGKGKGGKRKGSARGDGDEQMSVDDQPVNAQHAVNESSASIPLNHVFPSTPSLRAQLSQSKTIPVPEALAPSTTSTVVIPSDGLLLYVAQASYQPGDTPLACWVPLRHLEPTTTGRNSAESVDNPSATQSLSPMDAFELLVRRRYGPAIITAASSASHNGAVALGPLASTRLGG
ncbi:hypothetical protein FRB96_004428 [Tulasnella sp. 330]|nr:hypothetical protein FRB96_004428 [Tulasnella sp. 330]KAG8870551.1 hypothetical protein FRB97_009656 [Tulasnella sp. 331]KAG8884917.1 hypothetical protein FRB98_002078 [Tulasnella sp. 332]